MTSEHKCNSCFYMQNDRKRNPCNVCDGYNKYVNRNIYINQPAAKGEDIFQPDTISIRTWDEEDAFVPSKEDNIHSPKHYTSGKYEVIDVIEDWDLNFRLANTVKYIARHKHKGKPLEDLKKALWYLQREIDTYESNT